ncbi:type IV secretion system protein [Microbacterium sp. HA-8]
MGCAGYILAQGMSLDDQVASFVYYRTLGTCLVDGGPNLKDGAWIDGGERINQSHAKSGEWFAQAQAPGGVYLDGRSGVVARVDTNGATECAQTGLVSGALGLWDGWAPDEALCAMGMRRSSDAEFDAGRCTDRQGGSDEFKRGDDMLAQFRKGVSDRVYGGKEPTITANPSWADAGKYLLYLKTLTAVCAPQATVTTSKPTGTTDKDYALRIPSRSGDEVIFTTTYYLSLNNRSQGDGVAIVSGPSLDRLFGAEGMTCGALAGAINGDAGKNNGLADAYAAYLKLNATDAGTQGSEGCSNGSCPDTQPSCGSFVDGIGWIVCPLLDGLAGLNDMMWGLIVSNLLNVNPLEQNGSIYQLWGTLRTIANVLLIVAFLVIVFSQLTSAGVSNYGVKKMLPRLMVAAVAINVSYFIVAVTVDVFNITGAGIYDILKGVADQSKSVPTWDNLIGIIVGLGAGVGIGLAGISIAGGVGAALFMLLPAAAMAALAFVVALAVLMLRQALIPLLAVLAPVAIVLYLFPNTESWFTKWRKTFLGLLLLYPIAAFLFGGLQVVAVTIAGDNPNWFSTLTALIVMAAPLFMLPFIARQAGPMLGKIGGALGNLAGRARKPIQDWAGSHAGLRRAKYLGAPIRTNKNGNPIWRDRRRAAAQRRHGGRRERDIKTAAWNAETDAAIARKVGANVDSLIADLPANGAGAAYIRAVEARAQSEELKGALEPLVKEIAAVRAGSHPTFTGTDVDAFLHARATSTTHSDTEREAAMHQAAALGRDGVVRSLAVAPGVDQEALQRAISSNAGALVGKAPDIVKGVEAAFSSVTGADLAGYSAGTARSQMEHLGRLHAAANDMTRSAAQRAASQANLDAAVTSFNSAVEDITLDPTLQAKFGRDTGASVVGTIAAGSSAFQAYAATHLTGLAAIQPDGKIR